VQFGLITDKKLCAEPQRIIDRFAPEFEKIVLALCLLPWERPVDPDEAESWLFPRMPGPEPRALTKPKPRRGRAKRTAAAAKPAVVEPAPAAVEPVAGAAGEPAGAGAATELTESTPATPSAPSRPRRARTRRSAFAAARAAE